MLKKFLNVAGMVLVWVFLFFTAIHFTRVHGVNDCLQEYLKACATTGYCTGKTYDFAEAGELPRLHVEHDSTVFASLPGEIGTANGCVHYYRDNLTATVVNTTYCNVSRVYTTFWLYP